jgi:hypothetical protein
MLSLYGGFSVRLGGWQDLFGPPHVRQYSVSFLFTIFWIVRRQLPGDKFGQIIPIEAGDFGQAFVASRVHRQDEVSSHPGEGPAAKVALEIPDGHDGHDSPLGCVCEPQQT